MVNIRHLLFLLLFIAGFASQANAQDHLLKHYTISEGLPSSTVYRMIQDKDGYIWLATDVGVTRFDGKKFENFTLADGLSDNEIMALKVDLKGRLWFMGFNGTVSYWYNNRIYNETSDTLLKNIKTHAAFVDFFEDMDHRLWFTAQGKSVIIKENVLEKPSLDEVPPSSIIINGKTGPLILSKTFPYLHNYKSGIATTIPQRYHLKSSNGYWIFNDGSILFAAREGIILQSDTTQKLIIPFNEKLQNSVQLDIEISTDSLLWVTTAYGLYCYSYPPSGSAPVIYLKNKIPSNVLADKEGNIWIGTLDDGLYMIPVWGRKVKVLNQFNGLPDNQCYAVHKAGNGTLFIGLNKGRVITIPSIDLGKMQEVEINAVNRLHHIVSSGNEVWFGSDVRMTHYNLKTGTAHNIYFKSPDSVLHPLGAVKDITVGKDKVYIVSGFSMYECRLSDAVKDKQGNVSHRFAHSILQSDIRMFSVFCDAKNELWYGTNGGLRSKKDNAIFDHSTEHLLLSKRINSIGQAADSVLIFATHGYGLLFYKDGHLIKQLTERSGLCNDICRKVFVHRNKIYVATTTGVSVISYLNEMVLNISNMNMGNFLPFNDINDVFVDDNEICVATMKGLAIISQKAFQKVRPVVSNLLIKEILANGISIEVATNVNLSPQQNSLKFNFTGIYYQAPDEVNYRYRLQESQAWKYTKNTSLEFPFLTPGEYNFELQARVQNGSWTPIKSFAFIIDLPFWKQWWFMLLIAFITCAGVYQFVKNRIRMIRKQQEERIRIDKQITDLEQQALQTMMNPHFIFNVMNSIQHFINANDKKAANLYLSNFAKLIRMNLTISYKRLIPLEEEIDYLMLYLSFEKLRFGDNLTYELIVDPAIDVGETPVAVMMIQPFLENAIWHGILPMNAKGHLTLEIKKEHEDLLKIIITDNGVGINSRYLHTNLYNQLNESHGLSMTFQRLRLLGKFSTHELYIRFKHHYPTSHNKGTIVELVMPITH